MVSQWELVDKRLQEMENRLQKMDRKLIETQDKFAKALLLFYNQSDLSARYRFLISNITRVNKNDVLLSFEMLMKNEKEILDKNPELKGIVLPIIKDRISKTLSLIVSQDKITFDDFIGMIFKILGIQLAKDLVPIEDIIRFFGSENAERWQLLKNKNMF
jgi:hypothetical protein